MAFSPFPRRPSPAPVTRKARPPPDAPTALSGRGGGGRNLAMEDLATFRAETRAWLERSVPPSMREPVRSDNELCWGGRKTEVPADVRRWLELAAERGFTAPTWPREYGGGGLSRAEAKVLAEEMAALRVRPPLVGFGLTMIGPLLLQEGSEEQKRTHLPRITRGEIRWCQGYSEPGAGSDLASLQTRAVP